MRPILRSLGGLLIDLVFRRVGRQHSKPSSFDIGPLIARLRLALYILLAIATMPGKGYCLESLCGDFESASLAQAIICLSHPLESMIYCDESVLLARR